MRRILRRAALTILLPLFLAACAAGPEVSAPDRSIPTTLRIAVTGEAGAVLDAEGAGRIEVLRDGASEPVAMAFRNGGAAGADLVPGAYRITRLGSLTCRNMRFDVDPEAEARALGGLRAEIVRTTDYDVALVTTRAAAEDGNSAEAPGAVDSRPLTVSEPAPCYANRSGPEANWQERSLGERILFGLAVGALCAAALAAGGFCAF